MRVTGTLHGIVFTYVKLYRWILLRMRSVKSCIENQNTRFVFCNFFRKSSQLWDNVEKCGRAENPPTIWRMWLHAWYVRLHARKHTPAPVHSNSHTPRTHRNVLFLLFFRGKSGFVKAPQYYLTRTLAVLFMLLKLLYYKTRWILSRLFNKLQSWNWIVFWSYFQNFVAVFIRIK
jgi:hypothetical protein